MADNSHIEWTDATWNPVTGCSVVSPGCTNCYAMRLAGTRLQHHPSRAGLTVDSKAGPVWNGQVRFNENWLLEPIRWKRPRRIFVCAHGDLFHESVPDAWIDRVFAVMALAPQHTFQVLTKRSARMREYLQAPAVAHRIAEAAGHLIVAAFGRDAAIARGVDLGRRLAEAWPLPNVWHGISAEDQVRADQRIPDLLATPAAVRFLSAEPLLGPIDIAWALSPNPIEIAAGLLRRGSFAPGLETLRRLDQVIVGGESGLDARPMHPDWVRQIEGDCGPGGVAFFFKQWGAWTPGENVQRQHGIVATAHWFDERWLYGEEDLARSDLHVDDEPDLYNVGKRAAGRVLDGRTHDAMPQGRA